MGAAAVGEGPVSETPLYDDLRGRYLLMDVPDPAPPWDAQSRAYREMRPEDAVPDGDILTHAARVHPPLELGDYIPDLILLPEDYEHEQWDAARTDPRPGTSAGISGEGGAP